MPKWSSTNPIDIEFVYAAGMAEPRCTIDHINGTKIMMKQPCFWNLLNRDWGAITTPPIWIENVKEHLTSPGQFYFDRKKHELLYYPLPGQDMSKVSAGESSPPFAILQLVACDS
jgi:hypothetical protein